MKRDIMIAFADVSEEERPKGKLNEMTHRIKMIAHDYDFELKFSGYIEIGNPEPSGKAIDEQKSN